MPLKLLSQKLATDSLRDKNILVTGASSGIGKAVAIAAARQGANVILCGRDNPALEQCYDQIIAETDTRPFILPLDLSRLNNKDISLVTQQIETEFDCLHGLVHCAGLLGLRTSLEQFPLSQWQLLLQVNATAPFILTQALLPALRLSGSASILFTSSSVGRIGKAYWGGYAVSKFAVEGLMQVWAEELQGTDAIRVNSINPGAVATKMRAQAYPAEDPSLLRQPQDIAPAYLYLLSDASLDIKGQALTI